MNALDAWAAQLDDGKPPSGSKIWTLPPEVIRTLLTSGASVTAAVSWLIGEHDFQCKDTAVRRFLNQFRTNPQGLKAALKYLDSQEKN